MERSTEMVFRKDGRIVVKVFELDPAFAELAITGYGAALQVGVKVAVASSVNHMANATDFHARRKVTLVTDVETVQDGFIVVLGSGRREFHGWLGECNNVNHYGHGVRVVESIEGRYLASGLYRLRVVLGRDLVAGRA